MRAPRAFAAAAAMALLALCSAGCGGDATPSVVAVFVGEPPADALSATAAYATDAPIRPGAPHLLAVRCAIDSGAVVVAVVDGERRIAERRVGRLGENLALVPLGPGAASRLRVVVEPARTGGPLAARVRDVRLFEVTPANAVATAGALARAFEAETGRVADPASENLVANPDFRADDEARGTPVDWFAYVETTFDAGSHELRATGSPGPWRPFLATGPIRVEVGRRYRAVCRVTVERGAVRFRAVDYDELAEIGASEPVAAGVGPTEREIVFEASAASPAVRLRFDPVDEGADAAFRVAVVQMEALPHREGSR